MIIEKIPKKVKIGNTIQNLHKEDLPVDSRGNIMSATFESNNMSLVVILRPKKAIKDDLTGMWEEVKDSSIRVVFRGGKWRTNNRHLMMMMMSSSGYKKMFSIDSEDPTGLWRSVGAIDVEVKPVIARAKVNAPNFEDIDLKNASLPEEEVEPIRVVG